MKKILLACCMLAALPTFAQEQTASALQTDASVYQQAEPMVLKAADYLLSSSPVETDVQRSAYSALLIEWMSGTPDYNFPIDQTITDLTQDDTQLLASMMAAMAKYSLENKSIAQKDQDAVKLQAIRLYLRYCANSKYGIKASGTLQKFIDAEQKGKLETLVKPLK